MISFLLKHSLLLLLIILALSARLYRIEYPLLDWHSWRQADTASVSYRYLTEGIDILRPKYHDLSNIPAGLDNPEGYRMVEFPIVNALVAFLAQSIATTNITLVSRIVSIMFSLGTLTVLYLLAQRISGKRVAFFTGLIYALMPYSVYYGRAVLPEVSMIFFTMASIFFWHIWLYTPRWQWYLLTLLSFSLALLIKPFAIFIIPVYIAMTALHRRVLYIPLFLLLGISILPLWGWREWILQFPEGIPASDWLYNGHGTTQDSLWQKIIGYDPEGTRYQPFWLRWLLYERITKLMLGFAGAILLPFAFLKLQKEELYIYSSWWLGILAYFTVFAHGNVQHDYYQQLLIPLLALSIARGTVMLDTVLIKKIPAPASMAVISGIYLVALYISWYQVRGYFNINHWEYVQAGQAVQRLTQPNDLIITGTLGDTSFLFQTLRKGWPIGLEIEEKIQKGAQYFVSTNQDQVTSFLEKHYHIVEKTTEFTVIDLTQTKETL